MVEGVGFEIRCTFTRTVGSNPTSSSYRSPRASARGDTSSRRGGGRVVEGARLESVYSLTAIESSNLFLSASKFNAYKVLLIILKCLYVIYKVLYRY